MKEVALSEVKDDLSRYLRLAADERIIILCLGWARAQLGSAGEGVALIRQGVAGLAELGADAFIPDALTRLAEAQALATIEDALTANPEALVFRPFIPTFRRKLRLTLGQIEPAEAAFRDAACTLLAEIYGWFTQGFDTRDLQDTKALRAELGAR